MVVRDYGERHTLDLGGNNHLKARYTVTAVTRPYVRGIDSMLCLDSERL